MTIAPHYRPDIDHLARFAVPLFVLDFALVSARIAGSCAESAFAKALCGSIAGSPVTAIGRSGSADVTGLSVGTTVGDARSDGLAAPSVEGGVGGFSAACS